MEYESLGAYLSQVYDGILVNTMPETIVREGIFTRLRRKFEPKANEGQRFMLAIKEASEKEKRDLGDSLLESFNITDVSEVPKKEDIFIRVFEHFSTKGYQFEGFIGNGRLLRNPRKNKRIGVNISSGRKSISGRVTRVEFRN